MLIPEDQLKALIIKTGIIDEKGFSAIEDFAKNAEVPLADAVVQKDIISDENLGMIISDYLKVPLVTLSKFAIPENVFQVIPERIARKYKIIPFAKEGDSIKMAMADPTNKLIIEQVSRK